MGVSVYLVCAECFWSSTRFFLPSFISNLPSSFAQLLLLTELDFHLRSFASFPQFDGMSASPSHGSPMHFYHNGQLFPFSLTSSPEYVVCRPFSYLKAGFLSVCSFFCFFPLLIYLFLPFRVLFRFSLGLLLLAVALHSFFPFFLGQWPVLGGVKNLHSNCDDWLLLAAWKWYRPYYGDRAQCRCCQSTKVPLAAGDR